MFKKVVIANRGEIAVRIMATCREMGIRTVAVYSDADRRARHVREADEAYAIGPAPAAESYLRHEAILAVAQQSGAEAIHPGYGFLSENADFAEKCQQAGLVFIGPPASAMRLMGSKIAAKSLAQDVGVPTVPGYHSDLQDDSTLHAEAQRIGFPLLIKASAGGGGKGMRSVYEDTDFLTQLAGARREAKAAFGDETVFLERLILHPRHVEIQVLGDTHGRLIYLGERECSIQRRHQKIVEESPSVAIGAAMRQAMGEAAIRIARAAGYMNAGTVEFILDQDCHFYFLEMNTRLQVEHPVTELVTGLDLVRHQLRIAAGEPLGLTQEQISLRGHAIEVRLYAEDPAQHFLPSTGTITRFLQPSGPGIRVDSGIEDGDEITQYYDPMIAKLIVFSEDRATAIKRLQHALEECAIFGVTSNIPLLHEISVSPLFQSGELSTDFLQQAGLGTLSDQPEPPETALIAAALYDLIPELAQPLSSPAADHTQGSRATGRTTHNPWHYLGAWRMAGGTRTMRYTYQAHNYTLTVQPACDKVEAWDIQLHTSTDLIRSEVSEVVVRGNLLLLRHGTSQERVYVQRETQATFIVFRGKQYRLQRRVPPDIQASAQEQGTTQKKKMLTAPMAGTVVKVQTHEGENVEAHQVLIVVSAMKMEHAITAPYAGTVRHVFYQEGAVVQGGSTLIEMQ